MSEIHFMRSDQIFVLLLIILIPLTGCFENGVGDADAQDATGETATSVINNYYNNTSNVIDNSPQLQHMYVNATTDIAYTITISESEALEIVSQSYVVVWDDSRSNNNPQASNSASVLNISCFDGPERPPYFGNAAGHLWKGEGECTYTFGTNLQPEPFGYAYHSVFYKIHDLS